MKLLKLARVVLAGCIVAWCGLRAFALQNSPPAGVPRVPPEAERYFETRVRPVLAKNCFACHGEKVQMAGLRLDSLAGMLRGTDTGHSVLMPGDPEKSALIRAVGYEGPIKMPPAGKLPTEEIEALTAWIEMGALWPNTGASADTKEPPLGEAAKKHWAFQPVQAPSIPAVRDKAWVQTPIDAFVLAKLEAKGMKPSKLADRRTLIRRTYFDLVGLPPSAEAVKAFVTDRSPNAFAKVVDQLLASARYGERWGRYWLDIARYSDTKGYTYQEEPRYPYAYTYRDYVIRAFNRDLPYDRFLIEQIAADHLPLEGDKASLAGMGFLTLGRRFLNVLPDIIDDRLDVIFRGTQALTVGCARCHDHKYDPIPQKDYYSLYGVLANSTEPKEAPLIAAPDQAEVYLGYEKELKAREEEVKAFLEAKQSKIAAGLREKIPDYLLAIREAEDTGTNPETVMRKRGIIPQAFRRWQGFLAETRGAPHTVFAPWNVFASLTKEEFGARAPELATRVAAGQPPESSESVYIVNPLVAKAMAGQPPVCLEEVADRYGRLLLEIDRSWREDQEARSKETYYKKTEKEEGKEEKATGLKNPDEEQLRLIIYGESSPVMVPLYMIEELFDPADRKRLEELRDRVKQLKLSAPPEPPRAMVVVDAPEIKPAHVFLRGDSNREGEEVPRQFLAVLAGPDRKPFQKASGRLELAQAIASRNNPLTARVMVNRLWLWHFGAGLVRTPSDFGLRGDLPSHPELLDYLAGRFMEEGWSVKKMHRLILLSSTYGQSSEDQRFPGSSEGRLEARMDPDNVLLWKMKRRRLDFEAMRDSLLAVSGQLDDMIGGPAVDLTSPPLSRRRSVYGFVDRQNLSPMFRTFDFANPETHSPQRFNTTVPQQALFLMNSPMLADLAHEVVRKCHMGTNTPAERQIGRLYEQVNARAPSPDEVKLGVSFLKLFGPESRAKRKRDPSAWRYGVGELDLVQGRLVAFEPMSEFAANAWLGGPALQEPKIGRTKLSATGGHPGNDPQHAAVRRWIAPRDARVTASSTIGHISYEGKGDGIQAYIVSTRSGLLGRWKVRNEAVEADVPEIEIKQGDAIDFVVDCLADSFEDDFSWAPIIRFVDQPAGSDAGNAITEWNASRDFTGPSEAVSRPLDAWEAYAQVLLLANEFVFVD